MTLVASPAEDRGTSQGGERGEVEIQAQRLAGRGVRLGCGEDLGAAHLFLVLGLCPARGPWLYPDSWGPRGLRISWLGFTSR